MWPILCTNAGLENILGFAVPALATETLDLAMPRRTVH